MAGRDIFGRVVTGPSVGSLPRLMRARGMTMSAAKTPKHEFVWRGLDLRLGRRSTPVLSLVADASYPHLYGIRYPDGWVSSPANLTRARDAAYWHARHLLVTATPAERAHSPEVGVTSRSAA